MKTDAVFRWRIAGAIALALALSSCSFGSEEAPRSSESVPATAVRPDSVPPPDAPSAEKPIVSPRENVPSPPETEPESSPSASPAEPPPSVAVSANKSEPAPGEKPPAKPAFQSASPTLANLKLGSSENDVVALYGLPEEVYPLPGDELTIDIWVYDGLSVGLNEKDKVVFVELNSPKIDTGIRGLDFGMSGTDAAKLLGIPENGPTNVLAMEVKGGWIKIDLDPDDRKVLSLKLLTGDI